MRIALALLPIAMVAAGATAAPASRAAAGQPGKSCISSFNLSNPTPFDDGRLLFPGRPSRSQSYVAVFKGGGCRGMHELSTIIVDHLGGSDYCAGDHVRAIDPRQTIPGPVCIIDHFEPYAEPPRSRR